MLLNTDGSVASDKPIHRTAGNAPTTDGAATAQLAETGSSFPATTVGAAAAAAVAAGAGIAIALRRRRTT